jgi:ADP-ribose pyrophosphatase
VIKVSQEYTLHSERIYRGKLVGLRVDTVELPSGGQSKREIVEHGASAVIVALDCVDSGEEPLDCARRELEEETGCSAERWEKLGFFYSSPGFCTEEMHVYLATELIPAKSDADEDENIEVVRVPLSKASELIASGEICDAKSIAGLLMALRSSHD